MLFVCTHMYVLYAQRVAGYSSVFHSEHVVLKFLNILIKPNNHNTKQKHHSESKAKEAGTSQKEGKKLGKMNYDYCHAKEQAKCQSDIF